MTADNVNETAYKLTHDVIKADGLKLSGEQILELFLHCKKVLTTNPVRTAIPAALAATRPER